MSEAAWPYVLPLLFSAGLCALMALVGWSRRPAPGAAMASGIMLALGGWCLAYALALGAGDPAWKEFFSRLRFVGITLVPPMWLLLALHCSGRGAWLTLTRLALLGLIPVISLAMTWLPLPNPMWLAFTSAPWPFRYVELQPNWWFWLHMAYGYLLMLLGVVVLLAWMVRAQRQFHGQIALLLVAALVPFAANVATQLRLLPQPAMDYTPFCFVLSALATMLAIFRYRLLNLMPVARDKLLEDMAAGVIVLDWQDRIVDLNPAAQQILGRPAREVVGRCLEPLLPAWDVLRQKLPYLPHPRGEVTRQVESGERCYEVAVTPLRDPGTRQTGHLVVLHDITDLKRAREEALDSERHYRTLFEASQDAVFLETLEGHILDCNLAACRLYGYTHEEMLRLTVADLLPPDLAPLLSQLVSPERSAGETYAESWNRKRDGTVFPVEVSTHLVNLHEETQVVAYVRDITDRRQAEERWRWNDTLLRSMAETSPLAFYVVDDREDRVLYCNRRLAELWDLPDLAEELTSTNPPRGQVVGAALQAHVSPGVDFAETWRSLRGEIPRTVIEQELPLANGRVLRWFSTQIRDFQGRYFGRLHVFEDITDRQRAADAQRLAAVGQLAAGVAHEFNNILCSMRLRADLARMRDAAADYEELARVVIEGSEKGAQVCDDLLSFARPRPPRREALAVEVLTEAALSLMEPQIAANRVKVLRQYNAGAYLIEADLGQMEQVFLNLFLNACHAMPQGGCLTIRTDYDPLAGGQVVVQVGDTGTGIRPEHLPHIFEPFFTTKDRLGESQPSGSGLGLSVSHGLLQAHGATLAVQSEWGVGTVFELRFRALEAGQPLSPPAVEATPPAPPPGLRRRLLVAEDETEVRDTLAETLRLQGYEVATVADVPSALRAVRDHNYDLIISDLVMPLGDGMEFVAVAAHLPTSPPVLVITGHSSKTLERDLRSAGVTRWLLKPFGAPEFLATVSEMLETAPGASPLHSPPPPLF